MPIILRKKICCRVCGRWFFPDLRAGKRQHTCPNETCQKERRRRNQEDWRAQNPGYASAWRLDRRAAKSGGKPPVRRIPAPFDRLPWERAKDERDAQVIDFMELFAVVVARLAKDQLASHQREIAKEKAAVVPESAKDEMAAVPGEVAGCQADGD